MRAMPALPLSLLLALAGPGLSVEVSAELADRCPDSARVRQWVEASLGRDPFASEDAPTIRVSTHQTATHVVVDVDHGAAGHRTLHATTCTSALRAAAFSIAVALDPLGAAPLEPEPPAATAQPPPTDARPSRIEGPPSPRPDRAAEAPARAPGPPAAPSSPRVGAPSPTSPLADRRAPPAPRPLADRGAPAAPPADPPSAPRAFTARRDAPPRGERAPQLFLGLEPLLAVGHGPAPGPGLRVGGGLTLGPWAFGAAFTWLPATTTPFEGGEVSADLLAGELSGSLRLDAVDVIALALAGRQRGTGDGFDSDGAYDALHLGLGAGIAVRAPLAAGLALRVGLEGLWLPRVSRFTVSGRTAWTGPPAAARLSAGLRWLP